MADQGQSGELLWTTEARLSLLGPVRLGNSAGDDLTPKARKTRALLALVALSKAPVSRSRLADLLWGDRGEEQAKASLRQALYELRWLASGGYLIADRHSVGPGGKPLPSDLARIQRLIDSKQADELADALEDVSCPPLTDLDDITPELDEWLRDERPRLCAQIANGAAAIAEEAIAAGELAPARRIADQLERIDPLDERSVRIGIRADIAAGDRAAAIRRHARLAGRLKEQLGIEPSAETNKLLGDSPTTTAVPFADSPPTGPKAPVVQAPKRRNVLRFAAVLAVLVAAAALFLMVRGTPAPAAPTVAVLPFDGLGNKDENYFAAGVSDEILNLLSHQNQFRIVGRMSATEIAHQPDSLAEARRLGITHLLDGSVQKSGDRLLITVRLTSARDGTQLWSERYERQLGDVFAIQSEIALAVATRLATSFGQLGSQRTSPEVYDRYLAARQLERERRESTLKEAQRLLREAIQLDDHYAPAFAELSQVTMLLANHPTSYGEMPLSQARAEAQRLAQRAVQLDPNLGDAYAALGFVYLSDERSIGFYRKAIALNPQRPEFHRWLAQALNDKRRFDEAIPEYERAVAIDPLWELNYEHLIGALDQLGRDGEARRFADRFLALSTDQRARLQFQRFMASEQQRFGDALKLSQALSAAYPDERTLRFNLASSYAVLGERRAALRVFGDDAAARATLSGNWSALAPFARSLGRDYWEFARNTWNLDSMLLANGQQQVIVDLYDQAKPLVGRGDLLHDKVVNLTTAIALRRVGRTAEANQLLAQGRVIDEQLPNRGRLGEERAISLALDDAWQGRTGPAIDVLLRVSARRPLDLAEVAAISLRNEPVYEPLRGDPRFAIVDERLRVAINEQRAKAGLEPISREAWISDPKTLLTKN